MLKNVGHRRIQIFNFLYKNILETNYNNKRKIRRIELQKLAKMILNKNQTQLHRLNQCENYFPVWLSISVFLWWCNGFLFKKLSRNDCGALKANHLYFLINQLNLIQWKLYSSFTQSKNLNQSSTVDISFFCN